MNDVGATERCEVAGSGDAASRSSRDIPPRLECGCASDGGAPRGPAEVSDFLVRSTSPKTLGSSSPPGGLLKTPPVPSMPANGSGTDDSLMILPMSPMPFFLSDCAFLEYRSAAAFLSLASSNTLISSSCLATSFSSAAAAFTSASLFISSANFFTLFFSSASVTGCQGSSTRTEGSPVFLSWALMASGVSFVATLKSATLMMKSTRMASRSSSRRRCCEPRRAM